MARSQNKVFLRGNVATDVEVKNLNNGGAVANFRMITSQQWKDKDGERQERATGHNIVVYNENLVKVAGEYLKKGDLVAVEGELVYREYESDGQKKYITEIVLQRYRGELDILTSRAEREGRGGGDDGGSRDRDDDRGGSRGGGRDRDDDRGGSRGGGRGRDDDRDTRGRGDDRGGARGGGGGGRGRDDLDDDVPF